MIKAPLLKKILYIVLSLSLLTLIIALLNRSPKLEQSIKVSRIDEHVTNHDKKISDDLNGENIIFNTVPKSGSVYITTVLKSGLGYEYMNI